MNPQQIEHFFRQWYGPYNTNLQFEWRLPDEVEIIVEYEEITWHHVYQLNTETGTPVGINSWSVEHE